MTQCFFKLDDPAGGIARQLADGISATIFPGDQAMVSIVRVDPNCVGTMHHHPEEQWGVCISGGGIRVQGDEEVRVTVGDFWRTPGGVPHTVRAGAQGMTVLDVFAPPRKDYTRPGSGFGSAET